MKKIIYLLFGFAILSAPACVKLDKAPQGIIFDQQLNTPANIEKLCIAAYSALGNDNNFGTFGSMWTLGSIRSGDAYKGGDGTGDQDYYNAYEVFVTNRVDNPATDKVWYRLYVGIARANDALRRLDAIDEAVFPDKVTRQAEMRFLRAHFYFLLKIYFKHIPWIDETTPVAGYDTVSNVALTSDQLWDKIAGEFSFAADNLPATQTEIGRANKYAAKAYLAKTLLYQAYTQDDKNNVTGIDDSKLSSVVSLCDEVIQSGKYELSADFGNNFLAADENGPESIFAIQYSKDDGTPQGRLDWGHSLNYPMNAEYGCCAFHAPSQNMVNAFKTDADGLPMFTDFNQTDVLAGTDFQTNTFDPRLDHTVAIIGHPYKYRPYFVFQQSWLRSPQIYGPFLSMKETVAYDDPSFKKAPPFMSSSKNEDIIRFDDVLLWKAEALIELGDPTSALDLINQVRQRAANSTAMLKQADGSYTSNYKIDIYRPGVNCTLTTDFARQALRWERRLEFSMEGWHFFDLVRWGIADQYLNDYFATEQNRRAYLSSAHFVKNRDEYLPIPQNQINYSNGLYKQNPGW